MADTVLSLEEVTKAVVEVFVAAGKDFYARYGKEMMADDKAFLQDLGEDAAKYTYKMAAAKLAVDQAALDLAKHGLEFVKATMGTRLALRKLQLQKEMQETLETVLKAIVEILGSLLAAVIKSFL